MTTPSVPLLDLLRKAGVDDTDFLREAVEWFLQQLMEAEVTQPIGAGPHERTEIRKNSRNGLWRKNQESLPFPQLGPRPILR